MRGSLSHYRHPDPRHVWQGGSEVQSVDRIRGRKRRSRLPVDVFQMRKSSTRWRALWNSGHSAAARPHAALGLQPSRWNFSARGNSFNNSLKASFSGKWASRQILTRVALTSSRAAPVASSDADNGEGKRKAVKAWSQECLER